MRLGNLGQLARDNSGWRMLKIQKSPAAGILKGKGMAMVYICFGTRVAVEPGCAINAYRPQWRGARCFSASL